MTVSENPHIRMFNQDCMEAMAGMEDNAYELAIVDVQYGIKQDGRKNHTRGVLAKSNDYRNRSKYDEQSPDREYYQELFRVSQNQIVWGANHFISKMPYDSSGWYVWDKDNGKNDFSDCELAWTSYNKGVRRFKYRWHGMLQENMKNKEIRIHPNQKPVAVYKDLLRRYATEGDRILDTHGGSGSIAIACYDMGFELDWYELDSDYYSDAVDRFKKHKQQGQLFRPEPKPQPTQTELL